MNLLRFAELAPHIVVAQDNRNSTAPIDLSVTMHVELQTTPDIYQTGGSGRSTVQADSSSLLIVIGLSAGLGLVLVAFILLIIMSRRKSGRYSTPRRSSSSRRSNLCRCWSRCRCCKKRMPRPLTSSRNTERMALQDEIEKSAMD